MIIDLLPELEAFASLLDAQPEPVRRGFHYCLALAMVEDGKARLVETQPGEAGMICVFPQRGPAGESSAGKRFPAGPLWGSLARPSMSEEMEGRVLEAVRGILEEEGDMHKLYPFRRNCDSISSENIEYPLGH